MRDFVGEDAGNQQLDGFFHGASRRTKRTHRGVVSIQFESELANFYTEYYGTVKGNVAGLVTLSAHKTVYRGLQATFRDIVSSLQVFDLLRSEDRPGF